MVEQVGFEFCSGRCQTASVMIEVKDEKGKVVAHECKTCQVKRRVAKGTCALCKGTEKTMMQLGNDVRCSDCWAENVQFYTSKYGVTDPLRIRPELHYACIFCQDATQW